MVFPVIVWPYMFVPVSKLVAFIFAPEMVMPYMFTHVVKFMAYILFDVICGLYIFCEVIVFPLTKLAYTFELEIIVEYTFSLVMVVIDVEHDKLVTTTFSNVIVLLEQSKVPTFKFPIFAVFPWILL